MRFGVVLPQAEIDSPCRADLHDFAESVESLGFDHLLAYDHVVGADASTRPGWSGAYDHTSPFLEPLTLFSHLAATSGLEFVTDVLVLPQRQTALVAKQAATVDILTEGRFRLGVGIGWNDVEYDSLGVDFASRGRRFDEQIQLLRRLWTEESVHHEGQFDRIEHAGLRPLPVQRPIPIWIGCADAPRALERVGQVADGWIPHPQLTWGGQLESALDRILRIADGSGRRLGLQGHVRWFEHRPTELRQALERWQMAGATHVAINTLRASLSWPGGHIAALHEVAKRWQLPSPATR